MKIKLLNFEFRLVNPCGKPRPNAIMLAPTKEEAIAKIKKFFPGVAYHFEQIVHLEYGEPNSYRNNRRPQFRRRAN